LAGFVRTLAPDIRYFSKGSLGRSLGPSEAIWGMIKTLHCNQTLKSIYYWVSADNIKNIHEIPLGYASISLFILATDSLLIVMFPKMRLAFLASKVGFSIQSYFTKS